MGLCSVVFFYFDKYLPIWLSVTVFVSITINMWIGYKRKDIGVLMLLLWTVYALPFIHVVPYLWFDFENESPILLWGLVVNPYMVNQRVIELTAMLGSVGGIGFILGTSISRKKIQAVQLSKAAFYGSMGKTFSIPIFIIWTGTGVLFSWLNAPSSSLFTSVYTDSKSALEGANFGSAWMFSYIILAYSFCDAIIEKKADKRKIKKRIILSAVGFVVIFLQLLRGDRESVSLVFGLILIFFYWAAPITLTKKIDIPWSKIAFGGFLLVVISMVLGATRSSLIDISNLGQMIDLLAELYKSDTIGLSNVLNGTWSAVLLTPLSVAGDYVYHLSSAKYGKDYLDLFLSIPPGFVADFFHYTRPIGETSGPAWEMRYGLGGTHATVLPFMNFRMIGVLFIPFLWAAFFTLYEKMAMKKISVTNLSLLCSIVMAAPHWLWYGEKNVINVMFIWMIINFGYRVLTAKEITI